MMLNSQEEDHVELSINPDFPPDYHGYPSYSGPKNGRIDEGKSEPSSIERARSESSPRLAAIWEKPSTVKGIFADVSKWDKIFITSCIIAVLLDPLFFYIPYIHEDNKCLGKDKTLGIAAILLRSLTDITFIVNITYQIREWIKTGSIKIQKAGLPSKDVEDQRPTIVWEDSIDKGECTQFAEEVVGIFSRTKKKIAGAKNKIAQKLPWLTLPVFIDILAVLPLPQVFIVYVFFEISGSGYLDYRHMMNLFLLGQYVPRIFRIYLSSAEFTKTSGIWVKGAFNFFLYILASHVLGAFWYFFSIQRETSCWHRACQKYMHNDKGCMSKFYCKGNQASPNTTITSFLEEHCPLSDNITSEQFNFGIFLDGLKNNNTQHINFARKFFFSFWWGLRNLSNFGTNLTATSTYVWENLFAILISIIGLLLFLYLVGNVQTLMQFETTKWEEIRRKIEMKRLDLEVWMQRNKIPNELKKKIIKSIKKKLEEDKDANLENLFSILPWDTRKDLKRFLCVNALRNEPMLKDANPKVVKMICDYLKPVMYVEKSSIFQAGEPLDMMLFITQGTVWTYSSSSSTSDDTSLTGKQKLGSASPLMITKSLKEGNSYGVEQLLRWVAVPDYHFSNLPCLNENVRSISFKSGRLYTHGHASDLRIAAIKCLGIWNFINICPQSSRKRGGGTYYHSRSSPSFPKSVTSTKKVRIKANGGVRILK
ncbi:cyclic nucleotide-gated ion channel 1-like [Rosa rugosa]|uniref:cyclic nucleotide-gated ion channel 1-like n=1 Tax=Rosa rugosa TaxID=74645 RepID=UPI002B408076|nr:cyclic nucleotide-gated ion channel 1-like [Rosa rugosa]